MKRRVRQRLHKKLGSLLTCDEFGRAMEQFRLMEEEAAAPAPQPSLMATTPSLTAQAPQIIAVPIFVCLGSSK